MVEFRNLRQGGMSMQMYSLKFTHLPNYARSMVAYARDRMKFFLMGVSRLVEKECRTTMLLNDMYISRLLVYAQQIDESKIWEIRQQGKRHKSDDSSHQTSNKRFYQKDSSMGNNDKHQNKNSQGGGHTFERTRFPTCGNQHLGRCLAGRDGCFSCGNIGHKMRDFPNIKARGKKVNQASLDPNAPKNSPYGIGARKDK